MKRTERSPLGFYTIGIAALFLAGFFLLVLFGAQTYRNTVSGQTGNNRTRSLLSYFSTCLRSNDAGGVEVRDTEYGPALVIPDGDTGSNMLLTIQGGERVLDLGSGILENGAPDELRRAAGMDAEGIARTVWEVIHGKDQA